MPEVSEKMKFGLEMADPLPPRWKNFISHGIKQFWDDPLGSWDSDYE